MAAKSKNMLKLIDKQENNFIKVNAQRSKMKDNMEVKLIIETVGVLKSH